MAGKYDDLTHAQLVELLEKRDRTKKLGLVWERDEIEADRAVDANFVACRIVPDLSDKPAPWDNLVIEGDNFDALRWLRMTHAGRVKCIYIDPPYNTGNKDWVYNDRYMNTEDRFRQSTWLEFLYRRLTLARDLLAEDGVLLVSINDDQRALLELMMDEAMPGMRLGSLVWRTRSGGNDTRGAFLTNNHEHVLVFGKPGFRFGVRRGMRTHTQIQITIHEAIGPKTPLLRRTTCIERANTYYPINDPATDTWYPCNPDQVWRYSTKAKLKPGQRLRAAPIEDLIEDKQDRLPG